VTPTARLRLLGELLSSEGVRGTRDRLLDRLGERARRRRFRPVRPGEALGLSAPAVTLLATPPAVRLGGVQAQLRTRLDAMDSLGQPYALLYPLVPGSFRLEVAAEGIRRSLRLDAPSRPAPPTLSDPALEQVLHRAMDAAGASILHIEHLGDLAPGAVLAIARAGRRLILSVHDFSPFCPRPHLFEQPEGRFCHYCRDLARCTACLRQDWPVAEDFQGERRRLAAQLLTAAEAVVFPSRFLRETFDALFPGRDPSRVRVMEPPVSAGPPPERGPVPADRLHVAFLGGARPHKGSEILERLVSGPGGHESRFRWTVFGGGDPPPLHRLRRLPGVRVRGYYRRGTLPRLLGRELVDIALILSIVPESYSLALSEALCAGVPVVAFDHGAIAERIRLHGGGLLVPPDGGATAVARTLAFLADDPGELRRLSAEAAALRGRDGAAAAGEIAELYRQAEL